MDTNKILAELRTERDRIDQAIAALEGLDNAASPQTKAPKGGASFEFGANKPQPKRHMSAAGRRRISEAAKARWAKQKGDSKAAAPAKPKRKISAAGRARIIAATKARWARVHAAKAAKAPAKKARVMSPAARKKIAAAAKARWAKIKAAEA